MVSAMEDTLVVVVNVLLKLSLLSFMTQTYLSPGWGQIVFLPAVIFTVNFFLLLLIKATSALCSAGYRPEFFN